MFNPRRCNQPKYTWKEAVNDPGLGPGGFPPRLSASTVRQIAIAVYDRMDGDGLATVGAGTLASTTARSLRTVRAGLEHLETTCWLDVVHSGGRHRNVYRAALPSLVRAALLADERVPPEGVAERWRSHVVDGSQRWRNGGDTPPLTVAARHLNGGGPPPYREVEREEDLGTATVGAGAAVVDLAAWRRDRDGGFKILTAVRQAEADASMPDEPQVWTYVWAWARSNRREERRFPQEREDDRPMLPLDDYLQYEAAWCAAGSPTEIHPAHFLFKPASKE